MKTSKKIYKICKFIGTGGFKRGNAYLLELNEETNGFVVAKWNTYSNDEFKDIFYHRCVYSNWNKFLENWEIIG